MPELELPHTAGCFVCGRNNSFGLHLASFVDTDTGNVRTAFTPGPQHIGFDEIIHGGILATLVDELMVWTAIWASRKACVAGELSLRFVQKSLPGVPLAATATISRNRSRLVEATCEVRAQGQLICTAAGKYIPLGDQETHAFLNTLLREASTERAMSVFSHGGPDVPPGLQ